MATLNQPQLHITWANVDVTHDISALIEEFTLTDSIEGGRDEITLRLNNQDGRFLEQWPPQHGDVIEPVIVSSAGRWVVGKYTIDKLSVRFNPTVIVVSALAQEINRDALDKVQSRAFTHTSLHTVVRTIASEAGFVSHVTGQDVSLTRLDMRQESAHQLLQRLSKQYDHYYAIKGDNLLFMARIEAGELNIDLTRDTRLKSADFEISPRKGYARATMQYYDAQQKALITHTEQSPNTPGDRTLKLHDIANDLNDAISKCRAGLSAENKSAGGEGTLTLFGITIDAGTEVLISGAGQLPTYWIAEKVTTTINSTTGWTTRINLKVKES
ncbi:phage late control D family protein [Pseudoalteromonas luteoviolacea]|uniref:phage late control D family protein n=1 Tax=Pseudoalteromonas luteoviolacea TaxID=43657 RepID=UPI00114E6202|nr:hypothetical protein [Pseudoalteromonas luteoviolacea]TQF71775.1 hypothetical protein FLM44_12130 [Pseudoalteromonas luteoviolacea]